MTFPPLSLSSHPFLFLSRVPRGTPSPLVQGTLSRIVAENRVSELDIPRVESAAKGNMRIQYHKILSEGRSVRYDKNEEVLHLNVIVTEEDLRRNRARRST